jgi:hypothetical protein
MRTPFIAGNWKMHKTVTETVAYVKEFRSLVKDISDVEIVVAPPFTALHAAAEAARNSNVGIAAQDLYWERQGAFTGEVSGAMIAETGAEYVIVGHSERRTLFGETDASVNRKIAAAFAGGLTPIACIGETLDQRERGETFSVLDRQIKDGDRLRAGVGDRYGTKRDARPGGRGARSHSQTPAAVVWRRAVRAVPHRLRRKRQAGQHPGACQPAERRWRAGRRCQPRCEGVFRHRFQEPERPCIIEFSSGQNR